MPIHQPPHTPLQLKIRPSGGRLIEELDERPDPDQTTNAAAITHLPPYPTAHTSLGCVAWRPRACRPERLLRRRARTKRSASSQPDLSLCRNRASRSRVYRPAWFAALNPYYPAQFRHDY